MKSTILRINFLLVQVISLSILSYSTAKAQEENNSKIVDLEDIKKNDENIYNSVFKLYSENVPTVFIHKDGSIHDKSNGQISKKVSSTLEGLLNCKEDLSLLQDVELLCIKLKQQSDIDALEKINWNHLPKFQFLLLVSEFELCNQPTEGCEIKILQPVLKDIYSVPSHIFYYQTSAE